MKRFNWNLISKNRTTIFGLATLWITLFHTGILAHGHGGSPVLLLPYILKETGNCGVDIFLFVSGVSLYFSLQKKPTWGAFLKKRFQRVWLPTVIVAVVWYIGLLLQGQVGQFLLSVTGIVFFIDGKRYFWFTMCITVCYLLYTVMYTLLEKSGWKLWAGGAMLLLCLGVNLLLRVCAPEFFDNTEILWRRLPIFVIGTYAGKAVYEKRETRLPYILILAATAVLVLVLYVLGQKYGEFISQRYQYLPLSVLCAMSFAILGECKLFPRLVGWIAPITLEVYLIQEKLMLHLQSNLSTGSRLIIDGIAVVGAYALAKLLVWMDNKLLNSEKKEKNSVK